MCTSATARHIANRSAPPMRPKKFHDCSEKSLSLLKLFKIRAIPHLNNYSCYPSGACGRAFICARPLASLVSAHTYTCFASLFPDLTFFLSLKTKQIVKNFRLVQLYRLTSGLKSVQKSVQIHLFVFELVKYTLRHVCGQCERVFRRCILLLFVF